MGKKTSRNVDAADLERSTTVTCCEETSWKKIRFHNDIKVSDFAELTDPHPYGALPGGNIFFSEQTNTNSSAKHGIIQPSDILPDDDAWLHILGYCHGRDLSCVVRTCRYFYVAGHSPELWRDLVLRRCHTEKRAITNAGPTWKDTYVQLFHQPTGRRVSPPPHHQPLSIPGIYSNTLYRLHSCRSFCIPKVWLNRSRTDTLQRVSVNDLTIEQFKSRYEKPNIPVLIEEAAKSWKAFEKWNNKQYLLVHSSGRTFRTTSGVAPLPGNFSLNAYFNYCESTTTLEEAPLYLFDRTALEPGSHLWNDYMMDLKRSCPFWDPELMHSNGHDLFQVLGEGRRPDHTWLIAGPKRSGSVFHIDPNCTHAWNAAICGRKRWIFYPPGVTPPGVHPSDDGDEVTLPLSVGEWLFQFWEEHVERKKSAPMHERPLECTAMPGDVIFVPHGWWHLVVNLDEINIAITHNYVSDSNLSNTLKFLETKIEQISGCRDRQESIKPEHLSEEFQKALKQQLPDVLSQALEVKTWTCRAWKSAEAPKKSVIEQAKEAGSSSSFSFSFL